MNVKPGDLAIIVGGHQKHLIGRIVQIIEPCHIWPNAWITEPEQYCSRGWPCTIHDETVRPIRDPGDDAIDETLLRLPVPSTHRETETS